MQGVILECVEAALQHCFGRTVMEGDRVVMKGWVEKKGQGKTLFGSTDWTKRYVVVSDDRMYGSTNQAGGHTRPIPCSHQHNALSHSPSLLVATALRAYYKRAKTFRRGGAPRKEPLWISSDTVVRNGSGHGKS